jgi:hypothetical protein
MHGRQYAPKRHVLRDRHDDDDACVLMLDAGISLLMARVQTVEGDIACDPSYGALRVAVVELVALFISSIMYHGQKEAVRQKEWLQSSACTEEDWIMAARQVSWWANAKVEKVEG